MNAAKALFVGVHLLHRSGAVYSGIQILAGGRSQRGQSMSS